jgi:sugar porter (SP) family MFS transporter
MMMLVSAAIAALACLPICLFEGNYSMFFLGRAMQGVAAGFIGVVVPMYLAECLDADSRGKGAGMFQLLDFIGITFCSVVGLAVVHGIGAADDSAVTATQKSLAWKTIFWSSAVPAVLFFLGALGLKESPRWLYRRGKKDEALKALAANNGEEKAKEILAEMVAADEAAAAEKAKNAAATDSLLQKKYAVPFVLAVVILACNQTTGINSVLNYTVTIFQKTGMEGAFANISDVAIKIMNCVMTVVACALVDKKGRKFLLKLGTSGIIVGLCGVGSIFLAISKGWAQPSMVTGVLATIFFFMFIGFYAVGPGVCVWLALTELMPTRIRANGMAIAMIINQGVSAGIATVFPKWCAATNDNGTVFFVLAGFTVIYFITAAFFLPETKGRTLEEVEQYFTTGRMPEKKEN